MEYFFKQYTKPIPIDKDEFTYKKMSEISSSDIEELAKIYCTVFNQDNRHLIKELSIKGKSTELGIWNEKPYSISSCLEIISDYVSDKYFGVCAYGLVKSKKIPIGASVYQLRDINNLKSKGYIVPFSVPENTEFWCSIDTFRADIIFNGTLIKGLANKMRDQVIAHIKKQSPVLLYSSTNNPRMVKSWVNYGFTIVNKETACGNKFQAFKLI